ncbi:MAG TPA: hypothetical protein VMW42_10685 [Desulfatiglandales bacterium]|nr:hypothetical protein [Desulfatiglandales bacterium]
MKKTDSEMEFDFFDLDKNDLVTEWTNQPRLYFEYARQLADARQKLERAKAEADIVKAEVDLAIRADPVKYGYEKLTEALISSLVIQQKPYQEALKAIRVKKHKMDILQAAVSALDHRKSALENEVKLHGQNYFATPKATDEVSKETMEDLQDKGTKDRNRKKALQGKKRK